MNPSKVKALGLLTQQRDAIAALKRTSRKSPDFDKWRQLTRTIFANRYGQEPPQLAHFERISYGLMAFSSSTPESALHRAYPDGLDTAEAQLEALLAEVTTFWPDVIQQEPKVRPTTLQQFSRALTHSQDNCNLNTQEKNVEYHG